MKLVRSLRAASRQLSKLTPEKPVIEYISKHHRPAKRLYVWGDNRCGALGISKFLIPEDNKKPVLVQSRPYNFHWPITQDISTDHIAAGYGFTVCGGRQHSNKVHLYGFGLNTDSQLGYHSQQGSPVDIVVVPQTIQLPITDVKPSKIQSIACGRAHTVIATDAAVYSLGNNAFGQCGRPIIADETYRASNTVHCIDLCDVVKVVCGHDHTFLLTQDGRVYTCGLGADGQTGLGHFNCQETFEQIKGDLNGVRVVDISCRCDTVLALSDEGDVFGWGNSEYGQFDMITQAPQINSPVRLPINSYIRSKVKAVAAAGTKCAILNEDGEVFVWGYGVLGKGPKLEQSMLPEKLPMTLFGRNEYSADVFVDKIGCGINYFAAITNKGNLFTWGKNSHGCLGLGHRNEQYFPFLVSVGAMVKDISCGAEHMIALCKAFV